MTCIIPILLTLYMCICVNSYYTVVTNITGTSVTNIYFTTTTDQHSGGYCELSRLDKSTQPPPEDDH